MIKATYRRVYGSKGLKVMMVEVPDGRRQKQQLRAHISNHKQKVENTVGMARKLKLPE